MGNACINISASTQIAILLGIVRRLGVATLVALCLAMPGQLRADMAHPLDPLSADEIAAAATIIAESGRIEATARASFVTLDQPDKTAVLTEGKNGAIPRRALAVLRLHGRTVEAVVDLERGEIVRWTEVPGAQPPIHSAEWAKAQRLVKSDPRWRDAMQARGYTEFEAIFCESLSAGNFGNPDHRNRRLIRMPCYDTAGARTNIYANPIEGLVATVDVDAGEVIEVRDDGIVERATRPYEFDEASLDGLREPLRPVRTQAPKGWNFALEGRLVSWEGWSFHVGFDARFGPILSEVAIADGDQSRSVLYQAHVSEVFVPYMDPSAAWSFRTYMDAGEFGLGELSSTLVEGLDCPEGAAFLPAALSTPTGGVKTRKRVVCIFERDTAAPLWRHSEGLNGTYEGRPATELVVRFIPSVAHYDYVIDWVFRQSGRISVNIGATGIDAVKAFQEGGESSTPEQAYGTKVAPGLIAVHHDHFFSLRLDLDVDGRENRFVRQRVRVVDLPEGNPRRSLWKLSEDPMLTEGALDLDGPQMWYFENPDSVSSLGHPAGYQIQGSGPVSLLSKDDWPQRRAAFSAHKLWITQWNPGEMFAAGAYPNQSEGGDGLPAYVNGETVADSDIVAWYTIGFRHITRPEDWPILSTVWQGVTLRPFRFFSQSPGVTVRRDFRKDGSGTSDN